jgi:hypothetical protein
MDYSKIRILPNGYIHPELEKIEFTWLNALVLLPITLILSLPLYIINRLAGPNGFGYQKFIPQIIIKDENRIDKTPDFLSSWNK